MKNINFILKIFTIATIFQTNIMPGFAGRAAERQSNANQEAVGVGLTMTQAAPAGGAAAGACPTGETCQEPQTSSYIPPFYIQILGGTTQSPKILNTSTTSQLGMLMLQQGTTINTSFAYTNCMLTVHIFPPSNRIGTTIHYTSDDEYLTFYTLKDFAGNTVYKTFELFKSASTPTSLSLPHYIGILGATLPTTPAGSSGTPATFAADSSYPGYACLGRFFPHLGASLPDEQKIINGISPIVQNFLFSIDSSGTTASVNVTHISGSFGKETSSYLKSGKSSFFSAASATLGSDALQPLNISFNGASTPTLTFDLPDTNPTIPFTAQDLASGLILNVVIFPANTSGTNYSVIATIRTIDGTKLRKKYSIYNQNPSGGALLQSLPTSITLSQGTALNPILTTNILGSAASSATLSTNYFNIISPLNLSFIISQQTGKSMKVLMI